MCIHLCKIHTYFKYQRTINSTKIIKIDFSVKFFTRILCGTKLVCKHDSEFAFMPYSDFSVILGFIFTKKTCKFLEFQFFFWVKLFSQLFFYTIDWRNSRLFYYWNSAIPWIFDKIHFFSLRPIDGIITSFIIFWQKFWCILFDSLTNFPIF